MNDFLNQTRNQDSILFWASDGYENIFGFAPADIQIDDVVYYIPWTDIIHWLWPQYWQYQSQN